MWPAPGGDRQPRFPEAHRPRCVPGTRGAGAFRPRVSRGRRQLGSCWAKRLLEVPTLSLAMSPSLGPPFGRAGFLCESRGPGGAGVVPPLRAPLSLGPVPGLPRAHHPPRSRASVGVRAAPASPACWARLIHACALGLCGEPRGGGVGGSGVLDTWGGGGGGGRRGQRTPHREGSRKHGPLALRVGLAREPSKAGSTTWRVLLKCGLPPTPTPWSCAGERRPGAHTGQPLRNARPRAMSLGSGSLGLSKAAAARCSVSARAAPAQPRGQGGLRSPGRVSPEARDAARAPGHVCSAPRGPRAAGGRAEGGQPCSTRLRGSAEPAYSWCSVWHQWMERVLAEC